MFNPLAKLTTRLSTLALVAIAIATPGCDLVDDLIEDANDSSDEDEGEEDESEEKESGRERDEQDDGDDDDNSGPGGPNTPNPEPTSDDDDAIDSACMAYCDTELSCDDYYGSVGECMTSCNETTEETGECGGTFGEVNFCLAGLDCEAFDQFWIGFGALTEGQNPGPFPCSDALYDWAVCLDDQGA